ncbi:Nuclear transport factor 2 (NTF2) family protein with RNA binding (RRM-RBD-RNP motif) domain [Forsythia ovata]|uniref:Nuclear transport factor 2 (NTF2) family protein with RNA binding (RRM-RBD-RNP motif) domain n=1 Tax=Forsythia ovata TaxID=205694 RepID=A0ABD1WAS2_9LAMI
MAIQTPELSANVVANAFVTRYYAILQHCPENVHKFYQESSLLGWPGPNDAITPVTTLQGINEKIMSSDFKDWPIDIKTVDAQESLEGGVIVVATGLIGKDNLRKNFSQTFLLAEQEKGFYVLNDILKFFDVCESISNIDLHDDDGNNQIAPFTNDPEPGNIPECPTASHPETVDENPETVDENPNGKELSGLSVIKNTVAEVSVSKPSLAPRESVSKPPISSRKSVSKPPISSGEIVLALVEPVSNVKEDGQKISYASMVAKESPVTSSVSPNDDQQSAGPPTPKSSTPFAGNASKIATHRCVASNSALPNNISPKASMLRNGLPNISPYVEARSIYIGDLPYGITKSGVLNTIKQFGQVRRNPDSIQIRTHEDGFCCGFVEFESSESARLAVEAHCVTFGEKEAYITYKRSSNPGRNSQEKFTGRDEIQKRNFRGWENGEGNSNRRFQNGNRTGCAEGQFMQWQRKAV